MSIRRRDFLRAAAAVAVSPALTSELAASVSAPSTEQLTAPAWPGYDDAMVIDFLGSPGYFNYPENPPLDEVMVQNARTSGITAMNVTVSSGGAAST